MDTSNQFVNKWCSCLFCSYGYSWEHLFIKSPCNSKGIARDDDVNERFMGFCTSSLFWCLSKIPGLKSISHTIDLQIARRWQQLRFRFLRVVLCRDRSFQQKGNQTSRLDSSLRRSCDFWIQKIENLSSKWHNPSIKLIEALASCTVSTLHLSPQPCPPFAIRMLWRERSWPNPKRWRW